MKTKLPLRSCLHSLLATVNTVHLIGGYAMQANSLVEISIKHRIQVVDQ